MRGHKRVIHSNCLSQIIAKTSLVLLQKTNTLGGVKSRNNFYIAQGGNNLTIGPVQTCRYVGVNDHCSSIAQNIRCDYYQGLH